MSWISGTPAFSQRRAAGYQGSTEGTRNTAPCDTGPCGTHSNIRRQLGLVADFSPCSCQLGFLTDATTHFPHVSSQTLSSLKIRGKKKKKELLLRLVYYAMQKQFRGVTSAATETGVEEVLI